MRRSRGLARDRRVGQGAPRSVWSWFCWPRNIAAVR